MKLPATVDRFDSLDLPPQGLHLAIGMFDGVHLGHQAVIEAAIHSARQENGISGVLTFWPHPSRVLFPQNPKRLLMRPAEKATFLRSLGVDLIIQKKFTKEFAAIRATDFVPTLKRSLPSLHALYVGPGFRFGKNRKSDVALLIAEGRCAGIHVFSADNIKFDGEEISSTRIRRELQKGNIEQANSLLGYTYSCEGKVEEGRHFGRQMGFPTLNIAWTPEMPPKFGVYAVEVVSCAAGRVSPGVANFGLRPTVEEREEPLLEVHLLSEPAFDAGDRVIVKWRAFLRTEKRFESIEALKNQITEDKERACSLLLHHGIG